jgi:hypothetical protein
MAVLRFRRAAEQNGASKPTVRRVINFDRRSEDGAPNASVRQLPAPTDDLATKLAAADAAISTLQELLGKVRASHDELRQTLDDLKRDRDEWRDRAERHAERPWWRRLAACE